MHATMRTPEAAESLVPFLVQRTPEAAESLDPFLVQRTPEKADSLGPFPVQRTPEAADSLVPFPVQRTPEAADSLVLFLVQRMRTGPLQIPAPWIWRQGASISAVHPRGPPQTHPAAGAGEINAGEAASQDEAAKVLPLGRGEN